MTDNVSPLVRLGAKKKGSGLLVPPNNVVEEVVVVTSGCTLNCCTLESGNIRSRPAK